MNKQIQKIIEDFDFNSINGNEKSVQLVNSVLGVVDLGLPSGLLWCDCNLGANIETDYGDYFAWGETKPKNIYTYDTQLYRENTIKISGKDDAATQCLGEYFRLPSYEDCVELIDNTSSKWVENYNGTNTNGMLFIGKNGNSIFIPAAGYRVETDTSLKNNTAYLWTNDLYISFPQDAYAMCFSKINTLHMDYENRSFGQSIRPVFDKK